MISLPTYRIWWIAAAGAAGLLLGSFLNVCIARLPRHASIAWPGSHCPRCKAPIRAADNIPVLSFLLLRGRCRACRQPISLRYPLVEAALCTLYVAAAVRFPDPLRWAEAATLCFLLLGLMMMDAETFLLPDTFTLPGLALGLLQSLAPDGGLSRGLRLMSAAPFALPHWPAIAGSLAGAVSAAGLLLLIRWLYRLTRHREGMGLGDVKLAAMLGAWMGIAGVVLTLVLAVWLGAFGGVVFTVVSRQSERRGTLRVPFGSFLCGAALLTLFFGQNILTWYFRLWR